MLKNLTRNQKGSLSLEQILFASAVITMFAGITIFYENIGNYFSNITFSDPPANIGG